MDRSALLSREPRVEPSKVSVYHFAMPVASGSLGPAPYVVMERRNGTERNVSEKCFHIGKARDSWRETMLDVRLDGEAFALPYTHLGLIKCAGDNALTLSFSTHLVKIEGQHLRPLYEALLDHTVRYVTVPAAPSRERGQAAEPVITAIDLVPLGQSDAALL